MKIRAITVCAAPACGRKVFSRSIACVTTHQSDHVPRLKLAGAGRAASAHLVLAKSLFQAGHFDPARREIDAALQENPELAVGHLLKGLVLARQACFDEAQRALRAAVDLDSQHAGAWLALAHVASERGDRNEALAAVERALALDRTLSAAQLLRADLLLALGRSAEARNAFQAVVCADPLSSYARYRLARLLLDEGQTDAALEQCLMAQRLSPVNANYRIALGDTLRRLGRHADALCEYNLAVELAASNGQALAYSRIGDVHLDQGHQREAILAYTTALRLNPKLVEACLALARVHARAGRKEEALAMARAALEADSRAADAAAMVESLSSEGAAARSPPELPQRSS
jgi:tetratricopeptide (TPR) repeat protein